VKEIVDKAASFDRLVHESGWAEIGLFMANQINTELAKATEKPFEPEMQRVHVIRWDAMRSLLDSATGYIEGIQKSRDEIVAQFGPKESEHVESAV